MGDTRVPYETHSSPSQKYIFGSIDSVAQNKNLVVSKVSFYFMPAGSVSAGMKRGISRGIKKNFCARRKVAGVL